MKKKGIELSFAWLFALIVGATIIFLAVYISMKFIKTSEYELNTITAKQLSIIFEPLEVGLASGKSNFASLNEETRIYNDCFSQGTFGRSEISLSQKQGFKKQWTNPGGKISLANKYIFSSDMEQGKELYFFSKPFEMPFKISEIIFFTAKTYCFINAPNNIKQEIISLNLRNIKLDNCSINDEKVCFGSLACNISVIGECLGYDCENEYDYGSVRKNKQNLGYVGSLMYAAIFSSPDIYECNVKRLMKKLVLTALLYKNEADSISDKCGTSIYPNLILLIDSAKSLKDSKDLLFLVDTADKVKQENEISQCKIWEA